MPAEVTISLSDIMGFAGFIVQMGITLAALAFFHGQSNQRIKSAEGRIDAVEEKQKEHGPIAMAVARLETELEGMAREMKQMREGVTREFNDLRTDFRRVADEFARNGQHRSARS